MNMLPILVPEYVAKEFNRPLGHPNPAADAVDRSVARVYRLIAHALQDMEGVDWEIRDWRNPARLYFGGVDVEPYGLERVEDKFYIYAEERGHRSVIAIFKDDHMAAKYFVWLASRGKAKIDWSLFMEMEP